MRTLARFAALAVLASTLLIPGIALAAAVSNPLYSVSFSSPTDGYLSGFTSAGSLPSFVSYTRDGGATWHARIIPNRLLFGVFAQTGGTSATALGMPTDALQVTGDGGATWAEQGPILGQPVDFMGMAYLSGDRRVVVGRLHSTNEIAVIASSVSGGAWHIDFEGPFHPAPDPDTDPPVTYSKLVGIGAAPGGDVAWTVGEDHTNSIQAGPWPILIYKTADGGSSWTTQTVPVTTSQGVTCLSVADTQTAFAGQFGSRTLLRTRDGSTWGTISIPSVLWGVNGVNAIDALDKDHILFVGDNGRIGWSSNASADSPSFSATTTIAATGISLRGAKMLDATHWIVVGDNETILRTADGGATWTGSKAVAPPTLAITAPTRASMLSSTTISVEGTASDGPGVGVAQVEVRLQHGSGATSGYWNGSAWQPSEVWLPATTTDGWNTWSLKAALGSTSTVDTSMTITARARDGLSTVSTKLPTVRSLAGSVCAILSANSVKNPPVWRGVWNVNGKLTNAETNGALPFETVKLTGVSSTGTKTSVTALTRADGTFSFAVTPDRATTYTVYFAGTPLVNASTSGARKIVPAALVGTPLVPSYVTHTKYASVSADLWPVHTPGTYALTLYFERYELVGSVHKWVTRKTVSAKVVTKSVNGTLRSRATVSVKLPAGRSWRVRARHWDPDHLKTYSAYKSFRVY